MRSGRWRLDVSCQTHIVVRRLLIAVAFAALVAASAAVVAWVALDTDVNRVGAVGQAAFAGAVLVVSAVFGYLAHQQSERGIVVERQARWDATTKGIVKSSRSTNNHLPYSVVDAPS